jgi:DNA-binding beta-propeller fold protein YncE
MIKCALFSVKNVLSFLAILICGFTGYYTISVSHAQEEYRYVLKWGSLGDGDGQFRAPHDIEFDSLGNAYVTDRVLNNIQKFTHNGTFLMKWGEQGDESGQFNIPYSISIDASNNIYVVDRDNNRIQMFDTDGEFIEGYDSISGSEDESFSRPEDMTIDNRTGQIYVTDTGNNRIVKFDENFNYILEWGERGKGPGQFDHPHGIGVDSSGNVYVNDLNSARIQKYDSNGTFIKEWGSEGVGPGQFTLPLEHLFVDPFDYIWQVDGEKNPRISKFDPDGNFILSVGGYCEIDPSVKTDRNQMAKPLPCDGRLHEPEHAWMDSEGNLYVIDRGNHRVVVYSPITK